MRTHKDEVKIAEVIRQAVVHRMDLNELTRRVFSPGKHIGDEFECLRAEFDDGFRAVYSIEQQPSGWCHHISISVNVWGCIPSQLAIAEICRAYGMTLQEGNHEIYVEGHTAVNVIVFMTLEERKKLGI